MFGIFGIGGPFSGNIFGGFPFIESGLDQRYDVSAGMWRGAFALSNGVGSMPFGSSWGVKNYISNLIDWRFASLARSRAADKGKDLPPGADSPSHGTRGRSYLNQFFYNGSLKGVEQESVIKRVLGQNADPADKEAFKTKDNILRAVVQKVVGEWLHDPKARGQFLRKWEMARSDTDRARALLDPMGDGAYLQTLAQMGVPGALNEREDADTKWQKIANWFNAQVEGGVLNGLGAEAENIVRSEGWEGDVVLDNMSHGGKSKTNYGSDLVDRGYTNEEAGFIMQPSDMTGAEAEEMIKNFRELRQTASIREVEAKKKNLEKRKSEKGYNKDQIKSIDAEINQYNEVLADLKKQRAEQFLQDYMKVAAVRFGMTAEDFGYEAGKLPEEVTDVMSAVAWVYRKLGRNVVMPVTSEAPKVEEKKEEKAGPSAGGIARRKKEKEAEQKIKDIVTPKWKWFSKPPP